MSLWTWLKGLGKKESPSTGSKGFPQMVFLLREPMNVSIEFVRGAITHVFGITPSTGNNDPNFLVGDFPVFIFQLEDQLLQIMFMMDSYFSERMRPIVDGDLNALQTQIAAVPELAEAVAEHEGFIKVFYMGAPNGTPTSDPYSYIGRMLSAFGHDDNVLAIIWPNGKQIRVWEDFRMLDPLSEGRALDVFQASP